MGSAVVVGANCSPIKEFYCIFIWKVGHLFYLAQFCFKKLFLRMWKLILQLVLLNGTTDTVISQLMWSRLSWLTLIVPNYFFIPYFGLSSFAYCYQLVIVIKLDWPEVITLSGTNCSRYSFLSEDNFFREYLQMWKLFK